MTLIANQTLESLRGLFNVGVEFGQLSVILAAWLLLALWQMSETTYRRTVIIPGSLCIAAVGLYWTFERVVYGV